MAYALRTGIHAVVVCAATSSAAEPRRSCLVDVTAATCVFNLGIHVVADRSTPDGDGLAGAYLQLAVGKMAGSGNTRPSISVGGIAAGGEIDRASLVRTTNSGTMRWFEAGPEIQLAIEHFHGDAERQDRWYVSFAALYSRVAAVGDLGSRLAVGGSWFATQLRAVDAIDGPRPGLGLLMLFIPQNLELVWEHDHGANWTGFAIGWGF